MVNIKISDLHPAGSDLFSAPESYMNEISESEFDSISGGLTPALLLSVTRVAVQHTARKIAAKSGMKCLKSTIAATGINTPSARGGPF